MARPVKLRNPRAIVAHVEAEIKEELDKLRGRLSWGEFLTAWYLRQKEIVKAIAENENLRRIVEELKKQVKELQALLEKERIAREKAEKQAEYWKQKYYELKHGSKLTGIAKHLTDIAEVAQEGMSWKQACVLANIRDPDKIRKLLETVFKIRDEYNNLAQVFALKDEELFPGII